MHHWTIEELEAYTKAVLAHGKIEQCRKMVAQKTMLKSWDECIVDYSELAGKPFKTLSFNTFDRSTHLQLIEE